MKKLSFTFTANWVFDSPVKHHNFLLRCMPVTNSFQRVYAHKLTMTPFAAVTRVEDGYGNEMYSGTVDKAHSSFGFTATGFVLCSSYLLHEPLDRLFLFPTDLTRPSGQMRSLRLDLPEDDWGKAEGLCKFVHNTLQYNPGASTIDTTAAQAYAEGEGVARDYVQVFLSLCRLHGIPARYVLGLARGMVRSHVWAEVYCNGVWYALDPTFGNRADEGYLKIAHGLDYSDCPVDRYSYDDMDKIGAAKTVSVKVSDHVIVARDTIPHA